MVARGTQLSTKVATPWGQSLLVNLFTFNFGSTPTNFTLSVLTYAPMFNYSMDRPATPNSMGTGESVGGGTGFQFILDGSFSINPTDTASFIGLTGVHTVRFTTQAVDGATAVYPFRVPDHGSTLLLLTLSLLVTLVAWSPRWLGWF